MPPPPLHAARLRRAGRASPRARREATPPHPRVHAWMIEMMTMLLLLMMIIMMMLIMAMMKIVAAWQPKLPVCAGIVAPWANPLHTSASCDWPRWPPLPPLQSGCPLLWVLLSACAADALGALVGCCPDGVAALVRPILGVWRSGSAPRVLHSVMIRMGIATNDDLCWGWW